MREIKRIFIHCTAGYGDVESVKRFWKHTLKWKSVGYHRIVDLDGKVHALADYSEVTNGVKYYNGTSIHISYTGGVERDNNRKAKDTRTDKQKKAIVCEIKNALMFLKDFQDVSNIEILGHRDISEDKNLNGKVDSWERIKECPSFDAIPEYDYIVNEISENI